MDASISLFDLGWHTYFQQQLSLDDLEKNLMARVCHVSPSGYHLVSEQGLIALSQPDYQREMTIGDWVVLDQHQNFVRKLDRSALFSDSDELIAANIDTVLIVCALDDSFNLDLIKRYLELIHEAEADAIVILTKADVCDDIEDKQAQVQRLDPLLIVETVNAKSETPLEVVTSFFKRGKTVAILGAPGSGKSRLVRNLINLDDSNSHFKLDQNALFRLPNHAVLLDSPSLRELQANEANRKLTTEFEDVLTFARQCHFNDCTHSNEPHCAVRNAVVNGELDEERVQMYKRVHDTDDQARAEKSKPHDKFHRSAHSDIRARKHSMAD
ncbi:GTPase RsgA [Marinomonas piezotolerans]|uniref:GTPase RsgA n=1 Tax=Marinomonas piezotolerans TaxID=2213058 RepID=A0A370U6S1_9GAMM|nr:GTPase RsgA [Marinomonas piezotolerans]RDL43461.1 GTPase RsgA [Marinomonas piezotolerans]